MFFFEGWRGLVFSASLNVVGSSDTIFIIIPENMITPASHTSTDDKESKMFLILIPHPPEYDSLSLIQSTVTRFKLS